MSGRAPRKAGILLLFAGLGCSSAGEQQQVEGMSSTGGAEVPAAPVTATSGGSGADSMAGTSSGVPGALAGAGDGTVLGLDEQITDDGCGAEITSPRPIGQVDIIWVVDASGSMRDEQEKIGANISKFADDISAADVDVHIVMMTSAASMGGFPGGFAPMGGGNDCPAQNPDPAAGTALDGDPRYRFVDVPVGSHDALDLAVSQFSQYSDFLRPTAQTHFVIVTDDESFYGTQVDPFAVLQGGMIVDSVALAESFSADMAAVLGRPFTLHTISSEAPAQQPCMPANCEPPQATGADIDPCAFVPLQCGAAAPGATYWELAARTGGVTASICEEDWSNIFLPLTNVIVEAAVLPCQYEIPPITNGDQFVADEVNVQFTAEESDSTEIWPRVLDGASACGDGVGWYFDDDGSPRVILLCPTACTAAEGGGTIELGYGCVEQVLR